MIVGLGCDICNIERIAEAVQKHGGRFVDRACSEAEKSELANVKNSKQYVADVAKLFAAKEAFVKALGTGFIDGIKMSDIEVLHDDLGKPVLSVSGRAQEIADNLEGKKFFVSLSDDFPFAQAVVIIEK